MRTGSSLRLMLPVYTEAFVNLMGRILSKREKRSDLRLVEEFERRPIDVRVKTLHDHCDGFERMVDGESQAFRDWHTMMNERNALLHGTIDHRRLSCGSMYYDGQIPVLATQESPMVQAIERQLSFAIPDELANRCKVANDFIDFVLSHLQADIRDNVHLVLNADVLGYDKSRNTYGVVAPEIAVEGFPGPMDLDPG